MHLPPSLRIPYTICFSRTTIIRVLLVLWTVLLLNFTPSIVAFFSSTYIYLPFMLVTGALLLLRPHIQISTPRLVMLGLVLLTNAYFLVQGVILSTALSNALNASIIAFSVALAVASVVRQSDIAVVLKTIIYVHALLSLSGLITSGLHVVGGFNSHYIELANFAVYPGNRAPHYIFLPFTPTWSLAHYSSDFYLHRLVGFYREPGMAQIFFVTAFLLTFFVRVRFLLLTRLCLLLGTILLFSTMGFLNLIGGLVLIYLFNVQPLTRRQLRLLIIGLVVLSGFLLFAVFAPNIGVLAKFDTGSADYRTSNYFLGLQLLLERPIFGFGYYSGIEEGFQFVGIPGVSYQIGLVGLLLYGCAWFYALVGTGNARTLCLYFPALTTLFLAQASYNDPFVWLLMLINTQHLRLLPRRQTVVQPQPEARLVPAQAPPLP